MGSNPTAAFDFVAFVTPLETHLLTCKINIRSHNLRVVLRITFSALFFCQDIMTVNAYNQMDPICYPLRKIVLSSPLLREQMEVQEG